MSSIWWPAAGRRENNSGALAAVGVVGYFWSSTRYSSAYRSYYLDFYYGGYVNPSNSYNRSAGFPVRCVQERGNASRGTWDVGGG